MGQDGAGQEGNQVIREKKGWPEWVDETKSRVEVFM
jgi:hypothetical protein